MEITIKDFPDEIYLELNKDYKENLFKKLKKFNLDNLSKEIKVSKTTLIQWKKRTDYLPLQAIRSILKLLKKDINSLKKQIISYGTKKSKLFIKNPILPIKDSPELREIVLHMMCDGCYNKENGYAAYYNVPIETKEEFVKELKEAFGNADYKIYQDHVHLPTAIPLILKYFFKIDFNSKRCRIPKKFLEGDREKLVGIIRAAIIDEGTVDGSNVRIDSCNSDFLEDLKVICNKLGYKCGKTWESKSPIFRFNILAESIKALKKDLKDIPIETKQRLIDLAEKNQERDWKYKLPGEVKKEIIKEILKRPQKTIELIFKINLQKSIIGNHLRWLIQRGIVNKKVEKNKTTYYIQNKDKAEHFIKNPSYFIKSEKINNYGKSQLKLLRLLNESNKRYSKIEKHLGFNKSTNFKLVSRLKKKGFIEKLDDGWGITSKGKEIIGLDEEKARYYLYANIKKI